MATFGKITDGASTQSYTSNRKLVSLFTLSEDAILTSLTARLRTNNTTQTRSWRGVIYSDSAGAPDALLYVTDDGTFLSTSVAAYTRNFAGESLPAGNYWVGVQHDANATTSVLLYRDNTAASGVSNNDTFSDGAATPFGATASNSGPFDVYVTYTPDTPPPSTDTGAFFALF